MSSHCWVSVISHSTSFCWRCPYRHRGNRLWTVCGGLLRYLPRNASSLRIFAAVGLGSVIRARQVSHDLRCLRAAFERQSIRSATEVAYIVGLGSTGTVAAVLYFCIAFGKVTVTTLNSYGELMSLATIVSAFRRGLRISVFHRIISLS